MARAIEIVTMLRREGCALDAMDPRVLGWVRAGVSDAVLLAAMSAAQNTAAARKPQPIGSGLLDVLVRDAHDQAEVAGRRRGGGRRMRGCWRRAAAWAGSVGRGIDG